MRQNTYSLIFVFLFFFTAGCERVGHSHANTQTVSGIPMVVSVSSDGKFVVSSHQDNRLVFWDIINRSKNVLSGNANIYSAYFVKGRHVFLWQDLDDVVYVQSHDGKIINKFKNISTYGHVLDGDLEIYVASDSQFNLFLDHGTDIREIKKDGNIPSFLGTGKLLNLSISNNGTRLLSAGDGYDVADTLKIEDFKPVQLEQRYSNYSGVVLWELPSGRPLFKFSGNSAKTNATFSPNGRYVVSGCEGGSSFVWETKTGELVHQTASLYHGILQKNGTDDYEKWTRDKTGLIQPPKDLDSNEATIALKFIDEEHYLRFLTYSPYAVLYHIDNPLPLKYLPLGRNPFPAVSDYSRNAAIDTAPEAGILVMGQRDGGGIIVYKYDSEKQELEKIWTAD